MPALAATAQLSPDPAATIDAGTIQATTIQATTILAATILAATIQATTILAATIQATTIQATTILAATIQAMTIQAAAIQAAATTMLDEPVKGATALWPAAWESPHDQLVASHDRQGSRRGAAWPTGRRRTGLSGYRLMISPFAVRIGAEIVDDLRERLLRTRWPEPATTPGWEQGTPLTEARELCGHWASGYDWAAAEQRLNRHPQFRTAIDGLTLHFVHMRSPRADAVPLIMTHGWPGSVVEFAEVMGPLADPPPGAPAFHVVSPSLPGYGFSERPAGPGWGVHRIADAWAELMSRLGYSRFIAQGHDWGTSVSTSLAKRHPDRLIGVHLMPPLVAPDPATLDDLTDAERAAMDDLSAAASGDGYSFEQSTRPQTIGYGLVDSPAALCTWIVEKFHAWTDPVSALTSDQLLDNLMLYWLPATGASAARLYYESFAEVQTLFRTGATDVVRVPTACSIFPYENPRPSRRWAARRFPDIRYWNEPPRGGHFAAFEQPALFVDEIRAGAQAF